MAGFVIFNNNNFDAEHRLLSLYVHIFLLRVPQSAVRVCRACSERLTVCILSHFLLAFLTHQYISD
jgi:hypothetical protein